MSRRRMVAAILIAGVVIGCAVALTQREAPTSARAAPVARAASTNPAKGTAIVPTEPVTIVARATDPGGGTPWAVRRVTTRERGKTFSCVQLGRLDGKRFGWIPPGQPFQLARVDRLVPTLCGERLRRGTPRLGRVTLTTDGATGLPRPARTVVWGVLPPGATSARLKDGTPLRPSADRVVLAVLPGKPVDEPRLSGTLLTTSGKRRSFADPAVDRFEAITVTGRDGKPRSLQRKGGTPLPGRSRVAVLAPDPAGGAAWGILTAPGSRGSNCFSSPGRIVGDRLATVDPRLGLARADPLAGTLNCSNRRAPNSDHPLRMNVLTASLGDEDSSGSQQLRRLNDRTVLSGRTTAAVTAVTITTSRDIRTVVPDPRTHVVLAVYDGTFPAERLKITATLRDGRHVTVLQPSGG